MKMKLLDLQTGKYLELGKDFLYGGNFIIIEPYNIASNIMCFFLECFKDANSIEEGMIFLQKKALQNKQNNISDDVIMNVLHKSEPQEPLKTLCETTGAVVYGGRYVLLSCETWLTKDKISVELMQGHIFRRKLSSLKYYEETPIFLIDKEAFMQLSGIKDDYITYSFETSCYSREFLSTTLLKSLFKGNIFEEYSKQLRNELNKFDELSQHFFK